MALDTFLSHVSPGVSTHPFSLAFGALVFPEAAFLALVGSQTFSFWTSLWAVFDVVSLVKAEVAQVVRRWPLAGFSGF